MERILNDIPLWVQVCRLDGAVESVNRAATDISGYSAAELVGKPWPYVWLDLSEAGPAGRNAGEVPPWPYTQLSRNNGAPLEFEVACRTKQGETRPLMISLSLVRAADGQAEAVLLVASDMTRQKRLDLEARRAEKLQAVGQLASGVAHDINNNLAVILGYSEYLMAKLERPDPDVEQALLAIQEQSMECADTVRRIQLSAKPVPRRNFALLEMNEVVLEVVQASQVTSGANPNPPVRVEAVLEPLPPVHGHRASLREALSSLVSNAIDATPDGGVVSVRTWKEGESVAVAIEDKGAGIPTANLPRVFEPFFTTKGPSRSGLGLSIAYNLVTQQGGAIQVASQPGRGSTFTIRMPVPPPQPKAPEAVPAEPALRTALSVLVVDDEPQVAGVLKNFLQSLGYRVTVRSDGHSALDAFQQERFDLAVVDLGMPVMDGWELTRRLNRQRPAFPVVVATGWNLSKEDLEGTGARVRAVVHKPFTLKELSNAVDLAVAVPK
jgi:PAS domain S-box-containing protein